METQIKIIADSNIKDLEAKVNEWLSNNCYYLGHKIIDIKYNSIMTDDFYSNHCLIIYNKSK